MKRRLLATVFAAAAGTAGAEADGKAAEAEAFVWPRNNPPSRTSLLHKGLPCWGRGAVTTRAKSK